MDLKIHKISTAILLTLFLIGVAGAVVVNIDGSAFLLASNLNSTPMTGTHIPFPANSALSVMTCGSSCHGDQTTTIGDILVRNASKRARVPVGSNYQTLVANSSDANGISWGLPNGTLLNIQVLTSTANNATYTPTAGTKRIMIELWGSGGAGGSCTNVAGCASGGGGSGGYASYFLNPLANTTLIYNVGTGGAAVAGATGATGSPSNITVYPGGTLTKIQANGGLGGVFAAGTQAVKYTLGGAGAPVSTNGNLNGVGSTGDYGVTTATVTLGASGKGANCMLGAGGNAAVYVTAAAVAGSAGTGYCAGGSGGGTGTITVAAGGAGANGIIYIWEFT